ncbi:hypothetical protein KIH07_23300 [Hydrogenophaga taeniospiralis]|uniref:hypothetical protein n=1 Tax=Hydrogenophaga taeniospiralis TaxID=65656 RepID=UPI001CFB2899|nr:hypothetical protein [Hydrogenophaga taeniospiralis]MCB4366673.1 hypothetical protein [Hydrogenophaga taeniospiralis]
MQNLDTPSRTDQLVAPDKKLPGRRIRIVFYVFLCLAASLVPHVLALAQYPTLEGDGADVIRALGGLLALAVLTFPVGVVAVLLWIPLVTSGVASPFEAVSGLLPLFVFLGYKQWFVWIPKFVLRNSKAAKLEKPGSEVS